MRPERTIPRGRRKRAHRRGRTLRFRSQATFIKRFSRFRACSPFPIDVCEGTWLACARAFTVREQTGFASFLLFSETLRSLLQESQKTNPCRPDTTAPRRRSPPRASLFQQSPRHLETEHAGGQEASSGAGEAVTEEAEKALRPAEKPLMPRRSRPRQARPRSQQPPQARSRRQAGGRYQAHDRRAGEGRRGEEPVVGRPRCAPSRAPASRKAAKSPAGTGCAKVKKEPRRSTLRPPPPPAHAVQVHRRPFVHRAQAGQIHRSPAAARSPSPAAGFARRAYLSGANPACQAGRRLQAALHSRASICRGFTTTARSKASSTPSRS